MDEGGDDDTTALRDDTKEAMRGYDRLFSRLVLSEASVFVENPKHEDTCLDGKSQQSRADTITAREYYAP